MPRRKLQRKYIVVNTAPGSLFTKYFYFITNKWAQVPKMFDYSKLEILAKDTSSSLFGSFISYKENKVL